MTMGGRSVVVQQARIRQFCHGGVLANLRDDCHQNTTSWSEQRHVLVGQRYACVGRSRKRVFSSHATTLSRQHNLERRMYQVVEVKTDGTTQLQTLHISEILKKSGMHARDFLSLQLTTVQQTQDKDNAALRRPSPPSGSHKGEGTWLGRLFRRIVGAKSEASRNEDRRSQGRQSSPSPLTATLPSELASFAASHGCRRQTSAILPRDNRIVICFGHIRAVIGTHDAMIFEAHDAQVEQFSLELSQALQCHQEELEHIRQRFDRLHGRPRHSTHHDAKLRYLGEPFEMTVLEDILREVCDTYYGRIRFYHPVVEALVSSKSEVSPSNFFVDNTSDFDVAHRMVPLKDSLENFEMQVSQALGCLTDLLSNDEDMVGLLLTEQAVAKQKGQSIDISRHDSVELLLEDYTRQLTTLMQQIQYLKGRVQSHNELISLSLDGYRNRIIRMNLSMSVIGVALASSTAIAGIFGMNLVSGLEQHPSAFVLVSISSSLLGAGICVASFRYLNHRNLRTEAVNRQREVQTLSTCLMDIGAVSLVISRVCDIGEATKTAFGV
jgi:hypothetical protein